MSIGSRIAIGVVSLVCAAGFFKTALAPSGLPAGAFVFYGIATLFVVIAIACFFPQSHPVTLRIIGATIFCTYVWYVVASFPTQNLSRAIIGFFVWGVPSGYLAIAGKYPLWGKGSQGFNANHRRR